MIWPAWTRAEEKANRVALEEARKEADPIADAVIEDIFRSGRVEAVNALLDTLVRSDDPPSLSLPPAAQQYFIDTAALPVWARPELVVAGEGIFMRHGLLALASLLCASLPECYAMRNGVQVLSLSRQLVEHTERRVYETAQMIIDVLSRGGLEPNGRGLRSAQKVRLLHASMRYLLEVDPDGVSDDLRQARTLGGALMRKPWNPKWGRPICQEDMAFTLQTFSTVILRSWKKLGVVLTRYEEEAYYHCWRVLGHLIGVRESLNPQTIEGGYALYEDIRAHQQGETPEGNAMTSALAKAVAETIRMQWAGGEEAVAVLMRHLLGDATARMVGVGEVSTVQVMTMEAIASGLHLALTVHGGIGSEFIAVHRVTEWFGQKLLERIARIDRGAGRLFHLPESLRAAWAR